MATTVYFDLDGTLLTQTTSVAELFAETLPSHATPEITEFYVDQVIERQSRKEQNPYEQAFAVVCEEYNIEGDPEKLADKYITKAASATHIPPLVRRLVASVATQHQTGILTAGDRRLQRCKTRKHGLDDLVEAVLIADEDGERGLTQTFFEKSKARLPAETYVYISDAFSEGIVPAHKAGFNTVYVGDDHREDGLTNANGAKGLADMLVPMIESDTTE